MHEHGSDDILSIRFPGHGEDRRKHWYCGAGVWLGGDSPGHGVDAWVARQGSWYRSHLSMVSTSVEFDMLPVI